MAADRQATAKAATGRFEGGPAGKAAGGSRVGAGSGFQAAPRRPWGHARRSPRQDAPPDPATGFRDADRQTADLVRAPRAACGGVAVLPYDVIAADRDGAVVIPQGLLAEVVSLALEQERLDDWIMSEVKAGVALPGLYPPNADNKARYEAAK